MFHGTGEYQASQSLKSQSLKLCREVGTADRLAGFFPTNFIAGRPHMLAKYMPAGLVSSALLATVAFAQTPTATGDRANMAPAAASDTSSLQGKWLASKLG